ncbi:hypothetical protein [Ruminococcus sp. FC2018]|uniref:hypothetical protein n=1 Tax=Ruminococcus sp. FC2018 TaxID=1410617 RepID=UPI00048D2FB6|nr:hypothetical protein [Ruminococcus sp. FC2018]
MVRVYFKAVVAAVRGRTRDAQNNRYAEQEAEDLLDSSDVSIGGAVVRYLVQAFFNSGSNYLSPYFWLTMGICWSYLAAKKAKAKSKG